jgi:hypothetical protein
MFVINVVSNGTTPTVNGVTSNESGTNTWTSVGAANTPNFNVSVWKGTALASGACTVSVDFSSGPATSGGLTILEFSGMGTTTNGSSNTLDQSVAQDPMSVATLSATAAGVLLVGVRLDSAFTISSWTDGFSDGGTLGSRAASGYRVITGAVSAAPTIDMAIGETGESAIFAVYEAAAGGGGFRSRIAGGFVLTGG